MEINEETEQGREEKTTHTEQQRSGQRSGTDTEDKAAQTKLEKYQHYETNKKLEESEMENNMLKYT